MKKKELKLSLAQKNPFSVVKNKNIHPVVQRYNSHFVFECLNPSMSSEEILFGKQNPNQSCQAKSSLRLMQFIFLF